MSALAEPSCASTTLARGWLARLRWLLLRRLSQLGILGLFLAGPWFGLWIVKGNLTSSLTLDVLPLTDPYVLLQSVLAGQSSIWPYSTALIGAAIVVAFYLLVGGRVFCAWVCPVNAVTDAAAWSRRRLGIKSGRAPDVRTRYWLLGGTLLAAFATGSLAWEWVNPVSILHRGLIFGLGAG
ncbi:MAG: 4Fe-4S binding protein, partial [Rhodocyclaceae bacterium]|nr:4Fe-4S binding protein [Rhodocyclaceae bacterium]